jgi:hypothetical protein
MKSYIELKVNFPHKKLMKLLAVIIFRNALLSRNKFIRASAAARRVSIMKINYPASQPPSLIAGCTSRDNKEAQYRALYYLATPSGQKSSSLFASQKSVDGAAQISIMLFA